MHVHSWHSIKPPSLWHVQCKCKTQVCSQNSMYQEHICRTIRALASCSQHNDSCYGPRTSGTHPAAYTASPAFAVFKQLNDKMHMENVLVSDISTQFQTIQLPSKPSNSSESGKIKRLDLRERKCAQFSDALANGVARPGYTAKGSSAGVKLASSPLTALQQLAGAVADSQCVDFKEILESVEFVERVRKRVRRGCILDLAAGHGLVGLLLAATERNVVQRVYIVDWKQPPSHAAVRNAVIQLAPWVAERVTYVTCDLHTLTYALTGIRATSETSALQETVTNSNPSDGHLTLSDVSEVTPLVKEVQQRADQGDLAVAAVHACGQLTDLALKIATHYAAPVAVMPCCYTGTAKHAPLASRRALGVAMAADLDRCYRLQAAGCYSSVDFSAIPDSVTPLNRIIIAYKDKQGGQQSQGAGQ